MSGDAQNLADSVSRELDSFDDRLATAAISVDLLTEIEERVGALLQADGGSESDIRRVLQQRYDAGELRLETFQLVRSVLDRHVTEAAPTAPGTSTVVLDGEGVAEAVQEVDFLLEPDADDTFGSTTVIPTDDVSLKPSETRAQVGSVLRDRFLLQEQVSGESMGVVYKALDRRLAEAGDDQAWVAIKVLSPQLAQDAMALRALQQEASKGRCLVHPNIVRFMDLDRDGDLYFIVMEWLEGRSLADILDSSASSSIDLSTAFSIVRQVGEALSHAHRCGIVHADVKPGNIMIMPNGDAKLFDFGIARVRQQHNESEFDPGVLGAITPAYSSLQVLGGENPVASDDVFSLACLLYRLIAGYRVFGPRNAEEASHEGMKPQRPQGLDDAQWKALRKALSYARVTRYKSVDEFLEALFPAGEQQATGAPEMLEPGAAVEVPVLEDVVEPQERKDPEPPAQPAQPAQRQEPSLSRPTSPTSTFVNIEAPERFVEDEGASPGKWLAVIVVLLGLCGLAAKQLGYLDQWIAEYFPTDVIVEVSGDGLADEAEIVDVEEVPEFAIAGEEPSVAESTSPEVDVGLQTEVEIEESVAEAEPEGEVNAGELTTAEPPSGQQAAEEAWEEAPAASEPLVDFSRLPPPTALIRFTPGGRAAAPTNVVLREDAGPAILDFVRNGSLEAPLSVRLEEVGFTGNRSPWGSGQYAISDSGLLYFPAGQERARSVITMASDPRREADQQSTLRLRDADAAESELALVNVTLEDDDQRSFEAQLPPNTIAFASSRESISESDPAVQLDIVRFNPDPAPMDITFTVENVTATEGEDFFVPSSNTLRIGPGQRSARLLIPLVQDTQHEGDEAFVVELEVQNESVSVDVFRRVVIMIRDDDPPPR